MVAAVMAAAVAETVATAVETLVAAAAVTALPGQFLQRPSLPSFCRHQHHFRHRHLDAMVKVRPA